MLINDRRIGSDCPPYIIAEVAQSHDGNLNFAHAFIDAAADAGVQAVKFQTHIADCETTKDEPWRIKFSHLDRSRFDYWRRMEFTKEQWVSLANHCNDRNVDFISSAFSMEAYNLLSQVGVPAWKVASGEVNNLPLMRMFADSGKPVLLSSGMSSWSELDRVIELLKLKRAEYAIFQCTSEYPCSPESWGLNVVTEMIAKYECPVGLSDHSATIFAGLAAVALGASLLEVHVTFHRKMFGPDVSSSITFEELKLLVDGSNKIRDSMLNPVCKDLTAGSAAAMRSIFTKSIYAKKELSAGHVVNEADLCFKKPGNGISVVHADEVIGRICMKDIAAGKRLEWSDFEEVQSL